MSKIHNFLKEISIYRSTQTLTNVETENLVEATVVHSHYVNVHSCLFTSWKLCANDRWYSSVGLEIRLYIPFPFVCCTQLHVREPAKFKHINRQWNRIKNGLSK